MAFSAAASDNRSETYPGCLSGQALSRKFYLELTPPSETDTVADAERLLHELELTLVKACPGEKDCPVDLPYEVLKRDYPEFRKKEWKLTASLVFTGKSWRLVSIEAGDTTASHYGLAVDLGSTTVIMDLMDLNTGTVLAEEGCFNRQTAFGEDILSRIFHTQAGEEAKKELQDAALATFTELMERLEQKSGIDLSLCSVMTVGGNTTMIHFLLGIDAFGIFMSPFAPVFNDAGFLSGSVLGLPFRGLVYCIPSAANYLGGDIISGVLAADLQKDEEISLYIDIGTNGEMVVGSSEFLVAGAGAAGPALEGGISKYGMRADSGAVDTVTIEDGCLRTTTIGGVPAKGICGSGIVDLLAQLLLNGWMDMQGTLIPGASDRIKEIDGEAAVVYARGKEAADGIDRYFSQRDIFSFMDTKAAAGTMVACLLKETGISVGEVSRIYTAGSFGKYLNLESAVTIGLYPDVPRERFICIGNGSLKGACALLADRRLFKRLPDIIAHMHYLQFAMVEDFVLQMQAAKFFPHTDLEAYPTVKAELIKRGILK